MSDLHEYKHDDFEVVRTDNRFGGFEELRLKNQNATVSSHCLDLLPLGVLAEGAYRTHASSASLFLPINPLNLMICMSFCYDSFSFLPFSFELCRIALQKLVMKEGCSGTIHPMYTHNSRKWVLMSVPVEHYGTTGLAV
jgi:phage terminase large subunit-like protein